MRMRAGYGFTTFLGALLIFAVEPMAAKELLPGMGGSSAVWLACLCFFQLALLVGYGYAYLITSRAGSRRVALIHCLLLLFALTSLLLRHGVPPDRGAVVHPALAVFSALAGSIGLPFILLAAGSPLLQVLLARTSGRVPWRMFALSNVGSLLGLLLYPLLIEPSLPLHAQRTSWVAGFAVYATLCAWLVCSDTRATPHQHPAAAPIAEAEAIGTRSAWRCIALGAVGAAQLAAITGHLTENVAALPLLWVLPLAVYLLAFAVAFELPALYRRGFVVRLLVVMLASLGYLLSKTDVSLPIGLGIGFFLLELFAACWFCGAELYALRPAGARAAARFYLLLAVGGAAGTALIAIAFPLIFQANYDLPLAFAATAAVALWVTWPDGIAQRVLWTVSTAGCLLLTGALVNGYRKDSLVLVRNFYGSLRVKQTMLPPVAGTSRVLLHGQIQHGMQWFAPEFRDQPLSYYARDSGVGLAVAACCAAGAPRQIGIIGLGAGTMAAYGRTGDTIRFYEINPAVEQLAHELFTYTRESKAQVDIVTGDARRSLEHEPASVRFDVLAIDAFSGDAVPVHLLTREAMRGFRQRLRPHGIIAFHVSNQYLDLAPVVGAVARAEGLDARVVESSKADARGEFAATWVLVAEPGGPLAEGNPLHGQSDAVPARPGVRAWTDGYSSLLPIVRWSGH